MSSSSGAMAPAKPGMGGRVFFGLNVLLMLLILIQIFVAGGGLFTMAHQLDNNQNYTVDQWNNSTYWAIHFFNAFAIAIAILALVATAYIAKLGAMQKRLSLVLLGLMVLQGILGFIPWPSPIAALHVLNAFAMGAVAGTMVRESRPTGRPPA